mmetsp:Transcript_80829/g.218914  ORF Transcript_80829/g.218914 Transcript_80829/m.218914 type:complete len:214 (-) Transcript_80829:711-1352(-)
MSTTVIKDLPSRPEENGDTIDASASDSAMPACAARRPPQSLPPSPAMPTTSFLLCRYVTTLILSSGFMRANTTILAQRCCSRSSLPWRCRHAACVTASWASLLPGSSILSLSDSLQISCPLSISPRSTLDVFTTPHLRPMEIPVRALSPVQMTDRTAPCSKALNADGESGFISLMKRRRPQILRPASSVSRVMSLNACGSIVAGKVLVAIPSV